MQNVPLSKTWENARAVVRDELARTAFDMFRRQGFDNVTVNDIAAATGVSRSTFLRYFGTKEDAVLGALDAQGGLLADALRARPAQEDDWTALRQALETLIEPYRRDPADALATTRFVLQTPALCHRRTQKQHGWRPALAEAVAERGGAGRSEDDLRPAVLAAAALECLSIALERWTASDGRLGLGDLLDQAFAALAPR